MEDASASGPGRLQPEHTAFGELWPILALVGAFGVILILVPPVYEVPQNDDWAYYLTVQRWLSTGHLEHLGWNDPTLVFLVAWGALFARLFGLSYTTLRISTLALSLAGVLSLYGILRHVRTGRAIALLGAGALLLNPVYLTLSYSFNTDAPYLALATLATWLLLRARDRKSAGGYCLAGLCAACAYLVRQQAAFLAAAAFLWLGMEAPRNAPPAERGSALGNRGAATGLGASLDDPAQQGVNRGGGPAHRLVGASALLAPTAVAVLVHSLWFRHVTGGRTATSFMNLHPFFRTHTNAGFLDLLAGGIRDGVAGLEGQGMLLFPLAVAIAAGFPEIRRKPRPLWALWLPLCVAFVAATFWFMRTQYPWQKGWPYQMPYLTRRGALPAMEQGLVPVPQAVWTALTPVASIVTAGLTAALLLTLGGLGIERATARPREERSRHPARSGQAGPQMESTLAPSMGGAATARFVVIAGLAQIAPMLAASSIYDRYFITILPALIVAAARWVPAGRRAIVAGFAGLVLLGGLSVEWTRGYVDRACAWWNAAEDLVRAGTPPEEIQASFEWEGAHLFLRSLHELGARPPFHLEEGSFPWDPLLHYRYLVEEVDSPASGKFLATRSYRPFLGRRRRVVVIRDSKI